MRHCLEKQGHTAYLVDCLDRHDPDLLNRIGKSKPKGERKYGCGKYFRSEVPRSVILNKVSRKYYRYGLPADIFIKRVKDYIIDFLKASNRLNPNYYYVTGHFSFFFLRLEELLDKSLIPRNKFGIKENYFMDLAISFADHTKNTKFAIYTYYLAGEILARSANNKDIEKAEKILRRLKHNYSLDDFFGDVDVLLHSLKVSIGTKAPHFSVETVSGNTIQSSDFLGKFVLCA